MGAGPNDDPGAGPTDDPDALAGLRLFAQMAHPPNERGYCGPAAHGALLAHARGQPLEGALRPLAEAFDGPMPYLRAIAGDGDPFATDVVAAYWLGGSRLDQVPPGRLAAELERDFRGQPSVDWRRVELALAEPLAHHTWHVLVTYPWLPLLGHPAGRALEVLDGCRVRVGRVEADDGQTLEVTEERLTWDGRQLGVERRRGAVAAVLDDRPPVGAFAALHWDWLCTSLTRAQADDVRQAESRSLATVNRLLLPAV